MKKLLLCFVASFACVACYSQEVQDEVILVQPTVEEQDEQLLAAYANTYELLAFTYERPFICKYCDIARPTLRKLEKTYPITKVDPDSRRGGALAHDWDVYEYPTFVMVKRRADGSAQEIERWSGVRDLEHRVHRSFERVRFDRKKSHRPRPDRLEPPRPLPQPKPAVPPKGGKPKPVKPEPKQPPKKHWFNPLTWF